MKLHRLVCLSSLLVFSALGCCHSQCVSSNPCDPCARSSGCCLSGWFQSKLASCRMRCHNYSWCDDCSCGGCSVCGGSSCGLTGDVSYGGSTGSSCGCGQSSGYAPSTTTPPNADPAPMPIQSAPIPPRSSEPTPAPASESTTFQRPTNGQMQHVSVEEFQRLPGVVIGGPGSSVPTMAAPSPAVQTVAAPLTTPPALSNSTLPPRPADVQQTQWVPAK